MQVVEPNVSTDYIFLTKTHLSDIFAAPRAIHTVTDIKSPSGILATIIPIIKEIFVTIP